MALTLSGCWLISTMPPALSEMGPNTSIVSTYAAVDSIPIVATAVPNRPSALELVRPAGNDTGVRALPPPAAAAMLEHAGMSMHYLKGTARMQSRRPHQKASKPAECDLCHTESARSVHAFAQMALRSSQMSAECHVTW